MNKDIRYDVYHENFWTDNGDMINCGQMHSARGVLPVVFDYLGEVPEYVVDIGCGRGAWLYACKELGVNYTSGVDGPWVSCELEKIGIDEFYQHDLETGVLEPIRWHNLAICLEVAEHVSAEGSQNLVETLCSHSRNILFSSAPKGQGCEMHLNEQSLKYWDEKFNKRGYKRVKNFKKDLENIEKIDYWYVNNTCLYKKI